VKGKLRKTNRTSE